VRVGNSRGNASQLHLEDSDVFRKFILRGNVVDLAVAVVIGAAFGAVVQALVKDLITPVIGAFGGVPDFSSLFFTINGSKFLIGDFINSLLSFVLLAAVIYWFVILPVSKLLERAMPAPAAATHECPLLSEQNPHQGSPLCVLWV
jgi:large conductance mechanosensitive channel